jgi:hypothetical protein
MKKTTNKTDVAAALEQETYSGSTMRGGLRATSVMSDAVTKKNHPNQSFEKKIRLYGKR